MNLLPKTVFRFSKLSKLKEFLPEAPQKPEEALKPIPNIPQYPKSLHDSDPVIRNPFMASRIPLNSPNKDLPHEMMTESVSKFRSPLEANFAQVAIIGPPNAGKSSLFNLLLGEGVSAVSKLSHTTDQNLSGFMTDEEKRTQIKFIDTPGLYQTFKKKKVARVKLITEGWKVLTHCNKVLLVLDATKRVDEEVIGIIRRLRKLKTDVNTIEQLSKVVGMGGKSTRAEDEKQLLKNLLELGEKETNTPDSAVSVASNCVLVLNKIDKVFNRRRLENLVDELEGLARFDKVFFTSAETLYGVSDLKNYILNEAPRGEWEESPTKQTEMSEIQILEETIKECVYSRLYYEVPHWTGISLEEVVVQPDQKVKIEVKLDVDSKNKRAIVVGFKGRNLKVLSEHAQVLLAQRYNARFVVNFQVVVNKKKKTYPEVQAYSPDFAVEKEMLDIQRLQKLSPYQSNESKNLGEKWYLKKFNER